eukprot:11205623-Lingulodinium_polyedra.AAC.1
MQAATAFSHTGRSRQASWSRTYWRWLPAWLCRTIHLCGQVCIAPTTRPATKSSTFIHRWLLAGASGSPTWNG